MSTMSAEEAAEWHDAGFEPEEALAWANWDYWEASEASEVAAWRDAGFDHSWDWSGAPDCDPEDARNCATSWRNRGFSLEEAKKWYEAGFYPDDASDWKAVAEGKEEPEEREAAEEVARYCAPDWRDAGFTHDEAATYVEAKIDVAAAIARRRVTSADDTVHM